MTDYERVDIDASRVLATLGGGIDEFRISLDIYGPDLDPDNISRILGCEATASRRRGDRKRSGAPWPQGMWAIHLDGVAPKTVDEGARSLLSRLPTDAAIWTEIRMAYRVSMTFVLFLTGMRGFTLSTETVNWLSTLAVPIGFSIYPDDVQPSPPG